jgi:hypothetical protein
MVRNTGKDTVAPKKRRGPAPTGIGTSINVRLQPAQLAALDQWIEAQNAAISRPEAIRAILARILNQGPPNDQWMASFDQADE